MQVQSISKDDRLRMVIGFEEPENRQRMLRIVFRLCSWLRLAYCI